MSFFGGYFGLGVQPSVSVETPEPVEAIAAESEQVTVLAHTQAAFDRLCEQFKAISA